MGRPSLQEIRALEDPLLSYAWNLVIPNIPGGGKSKPLSIKCMNVPIPGTSVDMVSVALHGVIVTYAGMQQWTHQFQATFMETRSLEVRDTIKGWIQTARNTKQNAGTEKSTYATAGQLQLYDDIPNLIKTINIHGMYPLTLDDAALDGAVSSLVPMTVVFAFDYTSDS